MDSNEYIGISLIRVIKELAGRVRLLEEVVRSNPEFNDLYDEKAGYRAAYEEDEYEELVKVLTEVLDQLPELDGAPNNT